MRLSSFLLPLALCLGCTYYDASLLEPRGDGDSGGGTDAGTDAAGDAIPDGSNDAASDVGDAASDEGSVPAEAGDSAGCVLAHPPDPPSVSNAGGDIDFRVAIRSVEFGDTETNFDDIGYDLDFRCTCQGDANGCLRASWASADACDGPGGRDNMGGAFLGELSALFAGNSSEDWSDNADQGEWSLLFRVRGYNGLPDDDQVRIDWYVADHYWGDKPDESYQPAWDGTDTWPIRRSTLVDFGGTYDLDEPKFHDDHAYVSGGVVVGSLPEAVIQIEVFYAIELTGAFVTAQVQEGPSGWYLTNGVVAARWKLSSVLGQIGQLEDPIFDLPLCTDHPLYPSAKESVCSFADVYSGAGTPTTPCDSISVGMLFETVPAQFGEVTEDTASESDCEDAVNPAFDSCDTL